MAPPSFWNGSEWVCDQCSALTRAECCHADDINAARAGGCAVGVRAGARDEDIVPLTVCRPGPPLGGWGQTQIGLDSIRTVCR